MRFLLVHLAVVCTIVAGCGPDSPGPAGDGGVSGDVVVGFDILAMESADPGSVSGTSVTADRPFRLRLVVEPDTLSPGARSYRLEVRRNDLAWTPIERSDFPYPESHTPRVSVTGQPALVQSDSAVYHVEWPLVIRRWADGAVVNREGDRFAFRMVEDQGAVLASEEFVEVRIEIPARHLGGTFVETPGRIGPWQTSNGDLYFIMEPTETDNVLMMVKSSDGGVSWEEVDGAGRPVADDLEGLASAWHNGVIHILHQQSDYVWYHAFATSDALESRDAWVIRDELVSEPGEPPVQVASIEARSDGSLVAFYGGPDKVNMRIRSAEEEWETESRIDAATDDHLSGPMSVLAADDAVYLGYTPRGGSVWIRQMKTDGTPGERQLVSSRIDTAEEDIGSLLPLAFLPDTGEIVLVFRERDGFLVERRLQADGSLSPARRVSDVQTVQNAVDSDQAGADLIVDGQTIHVLLIEEGTGTVYHTMAAPGADWTEPVAVQEGVNAQWIRGSRIRSADGYLVYGYVFDAGSDGGSGMKRYGEITLPR